MYYYVLRKTNINILNMYCNAFLYQIYLKM